MYITDTDHGKGLVFTFNQLVFEFTFITTNFDNEGNTVASEILHQIGNLEADQSIVLTEYFTLGVDTRSGFSFLDFEGEQHWYSFVQQPPMQGKEGFIQWESFSWSRDNDFFTREENLATDNPIQSTSDGIHIVQSGDTLISISILYNTTILNLQELNGLGAPTDIQIGPQLIVSIDGLQPTPNPPTPVPSNRQNVEITVQEFEGMVALRVDYTEVQLGLSEANGRILLLQTKGRLNNLQIVQLDLSIVPAKTSFVHEYLGDFNHENLQKWLVLRPHVDMGTSSVTGLIFTDEFGNVILKQF